MSFSEKKKLQDFMFQNIKFQDVLNLTDSAEAQNTRFGRSLDMSDFM